MPMPTVRITWFSGRMESTFKTGLIRYFWMPDAEQEQGRRRDEDGKIGVDMERGEEHEGDVHGHHHELAVGEVDDLHHAHDDGHADAEQRVEAAEQEALDQGLEKDLERELRS